MKPARIPWPEMTNLALNSPPGHCGWGRGGNKTGPWGSGQAGLDSALQGPWAVPSLPAQATSFSLVKFTEAPSSRGALPLQVRAAVKARRQVRAVHQRRSPGKEAATQACGRQEICCWKRMKYL